MAKQLKLTAQTRFTTGRSAVKKIKQQGLVPAVVYGGHDQPQSLTLKAREIGKLLAHATSEHVLVDLEITDGGTTTNRLALIQEVQHDALSRAGGLYARLAELQFGEVVVSAAADAPSHPRRGDPP